jgi:hypothetical protein
MDLLKGLGILYRNADRNLGGILPGGGTPNAASGFARKAIDTVKEQYQRNKDVIPLFLGSVGVNTLSKSVMKNATDQINRKLYNAAKQDQLVPYLEEVQNERQRILNVVNPELQRAGAKGLSIEGKAQYNINQQLTNPNPSVDYTDSLDFIGKGEHFKASAPTPFADTSGKRNVAVKMSTPGWVAAHEFGHAIDSLKNPGIFFDDRGIEADPDWKGPFLDREWGWRERRSKFAPDRSSAMGLLMAAKGGEDKNFLQAGIEGAAANLLESWPTLRKEAMADVYGRRIAKKAGVPWDERGNFFAKGTYALPQVSKGLADGLISEALNRVGNTAVDYFSTGLNALVDRARGQRGPKGLQGLEQYGYDPALYGGNYVPGSPGQIKLRKRTTPEQMLYKFIN